MDIDHLKDIGQVDTFPISIDSSARDQRVFPTPAEYEVQFDTPFVNVVGFDVLDATIPNTMYVVDSHNRRLSLAALLAAGDGPGARPVDAYLSDLAQMPEFAALWSGVGYERLRLKMAGRLLPVSQLQQLQEAAAPDAPAVILDVDVPLLPLLSPSPQQRASALSVEPGSRCVLTTDGARFFADDGGGPVELATTESGGELRVVVTASFRNAASDAAAWDGKRVLYATAGVLDLLRSPMAAGKAMLSPRVEGGRLLSVSSYGIFRVGDDFYDAMTNDPKPPVAPAGQAPDPRNPFNLNTATYDHEMVFHNLRLEEGNHTALSLVEAIEFAMPTYVPAGSESVEGSEQPLIRLRPTTSVTDANRPDYDRQKRVRFESPFRFWLDMQKSTVRQVLGFNELAADGSPRYAPYRLADNLRIFESRSAVSSGALQVIESPGVMSLVAERMVVLRCPQIEDHAFPSLSHGAFAAGLGVFKLYDLAVAHLRFDFTKLSRLHFHPIGKLSKLRFRFETLDGALYNFKGVDHHLFVSIRFLVPRSERTLPPPRNRLNPDYDPNVVRYQVLRGGQQDRADSESDDELLQDPGHIARFRESRRLSRLREEAMAPLGEARPRGGYSGSESGGDSSGGGYSGSESGGDDLSEYTVRKRNAVRPRP